MPPHPPPPAMGRPRWTQWAINGGDGAAGAGKGGFSRCLRALTERGRCKCAYWRLLLTRPLGDSGARGDGWRCGRRGAAFGSRPSPAPLPGAGTLTPTEQPSKEASRGRWASMGIVPPAEGRSWSLEPGGDARPGERPRDRGGPSLGRSELSAASPVCLFLSGGHPSGGAPEPLGSSRARVQAALSVLWVWMRLRGEAHGQLEQLSGSGGTCA